MSEPKKYTSLVTLFLDVIAGLTGTVVQAFDGQDHHYFVVERYNPEAFQKRYPNLRSFAKLGTAKGNVFKAKINYEGADFDYHEFSQQGVRCQNCDFADSINFHSGVPADRANEIWNALVKHQKSECKNPIFNLVR
ncbi:MAG: hypothetical protein UW68_C0060G0001 [Candidatus Collierbacteria bacterium GW2011_GWB1_44_6]|uniref:Uncharacterized protein n=2 Tax=Candidatus Collieribacteriota TaxID=1752725 RepID=A0A0G1JJW4_9BACT|nr:MAG: hypothetical protein UV68_C0058G0010 [Candidatus Collierbacteria bacterium GW2011_GWC2_43_12]KKT71630.1 MAG: hypothetical protein UW68_C0060G0001 [Candidatus Collierbacteria bacterium GW2011_GWB1_44_6]